VKPQLQSYLQTSLEALIVSGDLPAEAEGIPHIERTRDRDHGDFASNIAMTLARVARKKPRDIAEMIVSKLPENHLVEKTEIAGPGFINFYLTPAAYHETLKLIHKHHNDYGKSKIGQNRKVQIEFVSANPTGPLHVGHGRGAAYGSVVASLLDVTGFDVTREYYVNDAGRQMDILAASVWLRYLELAGEAVPFPSNGYKGDYIREIAEELRQTHGDDFRKNIDEVMAGVPQDAPDGDKEAHIDGLIDKAKKLLGPAHYRSVFGAGLNAILQDIRDDLAEFGVTYDEWFSERSLMDTDVVARSMQKLQDAEHIYEKGGALWFKSTAFGDEKDRVVQRDNGQTTYFASDIAYHQNKIDRGYEKIIDVWGADHHGYVPRVKASLQALGHNDDVLDVLLVQFAVLYRGGEKVQMSTRSGDFVTLRELREEVGNDAARFFYVMRKCEQHLDFDLDLAKSKSNENPVYYVQYAHARICSVFRELNEKGYHFDPAVAEKYLDQLNTEHEQTLMVSLARFPEVVEAAAINYEPHQIPHYLRELSNDLHTYYNAHKFLVEEENVRNARMYLIHATRQVLQNGLRILGVSAPEAM
jgi:arginyl-tRNA synthetase